MIYLLNARILLESNSGLVYLEVSSSTNVDLCPAETWRDLSIPAVLPTRHHDRYGR